MCNCTPLMHMVCKVSHLIAGLAAINIGLSAVFGVDVAVMYLMSVKMPLDIIVGVAGVVTVVTCLMHIMGHRCRCNGSNA